jgi:hypothetical protein
MRDAQRDPRPCLAKIPHDSENVHPNAGHRLETTKTKFKKAGKKKQLKKEAIRLPLSAETSHITKVKPLEENQRKFETPIVSSRKNKCYCHVYSNNAKAASSGNCKKYHSYRFAFFDAVYFVPVNFVCI